jgi:hypothetical protein
MPIHPEWLVQRGILIDPHQGRVEIANELVSAIAWTEALVRFKHQNWAAAQDIEEQHHSQPADPFPHPAPGISLLPVLSFTVHAASLGIIGASAQLKSCGTGSIN